MSGIYIQNVEMPKSCWDCQFCGDFDCLEPRVCFACMCDFEDGVDMYEHSRPDWCPLIPVPKHGRLIDADELKRHQFIVSLPCQGRGLPYIFGWNDAIDAITDNAPTIIAADKQEGE